MSTIVTCDENRIENKNMNTDDIIKTQVYKLEKPKKLYQETNTRTNKLILQKIFRITTKLSRLHMSYCPATTCFSI